VATLRRQFGVIMGKTHMVEFAFGGTGQNSHHGAPYQPVGCRGASLGRRFVERRWR
jgi:Asp-tRNA(Asn)/Glu-tRNA(Gln) amidotransferase A subunit family amidase